jgi:hypothetical protein
MVPETFSDGIGRVFFSEGMVRIELISLSGGESDENGAPRGEVRQRIVMTPHAFLRSLQVQHQVVAKLQEAGVIVPANGAGAAAKAEPTATVTAPKPPRTPNFSTG